MPPRPAQKQPARPKIPRQCSGFRQQLKMFLVPCSCGTSFAVNADYDRKGSNLSRYIICPKCGKRHDPKNRLLEIGFQEEGYWKVEKC